MDDGPTTPFHWDGEAGYRRNPALSEELAALLQRIARAATTRLLTEAEDAALIEYRAARDDVSLNAVLAALERAGT